MSRKPLQLLSEFAAEVRLTGSRFLVVEGLSDLSFFKQWIAGADFDEKTRPTVIPVGALEVDAGELIGLGLNDAERSRVIYVAMFLESEKLDLVRCVADRDAEHDVKRFAPSPLLWTDFPAIESYGFEASVLDTLNTLFLGGRLPDGADVITLVSPILLELYTVRTHNQHLPTPDIGKGLSWSKGGYSFRVEKTVPPELANDVGDYARPSYSDPRLHAYGHDVCAVIICLFGNAVKNQAGVRNQETLEDMLRASVLVRAGIRTLPLFKQILDWAV
jgi:hypothetical protein